MKKTFSLRLRKLRKGLFLSQAEIAQRLGISQQSWQRYEAGSVYPGVVWLHQICEKFQISADWLLGFSETQRTRESRNPEDPLPIGEEAPPAYDAQDENAQHWMRRAMRAEVKVETLEKELDKQRAFVRELTLRLQEAGLASPKKKKGGQTGGKTVDAE